MIEIFEEEKGRELSQSEFFRVAGLSGYQSFGDMTEEEWRTIIKHHYKDIVNLL
jgi:hypothetical protein